MNISNISICRVGNIIKYKKSDFFKNTFVLVSLGLPI